MKTLYLKKPIEPALGKCNLISRIYIYVLLLLVMTQSSLVFSQSVLFDFDNAPVYSSLPINLTVNGITANFSATGQGYSIQDAGVLGFVPQGFAGHCIYPNSIYLADLLISFDQMLTDFSIMYSCQELGCDDAATMRVTAYLNGTLTGTSTKTASNPGTWPVETLSCNFTQGFDSVVVHYDSRPPTCQDYGVIFLADNMRVTAINSKVILAPELKLETLITPNPASKSTTICVSLFQSENIHVAIFGINGKLIKNLFDGRLNMGENQIKWDINSDAVNSGVYLLRVTGDSFAQSSKIVVVK